MKKMNNAAINNILQFYKENDKELNPELMQDIINLSEHFHVEETINKVFCYDSEIIHALSNLSDKMFITVLINKLSKYNSTEVSKEELLFFLSMCQKYVPENPTLNFDYSLDISEFLPFILNNPNFYEITEFVASHPFYLDITIFKNIIRILNYIPGCDIMKILREIDDIHDINEKFKTASTIIEEKMQEALIANANNSPEILLEINIEYMIAIKSLKKYQKNCEFAYNSYQTLSRTREK